jgi:conjugal transfer/entry exclusion protein
MSSCNSCKRQVQTFSVIQWNSLKGWCSSECWVKEMNEAKEQAAKAAAAEAENQRFLRTGVKVYMPGTVR